MRTEAVSDIALVRYLGSKRQLLPSYPRPRHAHIVEPFAGGANYALRYGRRRDVTLVEKSASMAALWKWLCGDATRSEILGLPTHKTLPMSGIPVEGLRDEANFLLALTELSMSDGTTKRVDTSVRLTTAHYTTRQRWETIAAALPHLKHWRVIHGDYTDAPDVEATWFIDPPYSQKNLRNTYAASVGSYSDLAAWCRSRKGQAIVCEHTSATWLPFRTLPLRRKIKVRRAGVKRPGREAIWTNEDQAYA